MVKLHRNILPSRIDQRSIEVSMISSAVFYLEKKHLYVENGRFPKIYKPWSEIFPGVQSPDPFSFHHSFQTIYPRLPNQSKKAALQEAVPKI